MNRTIAATHQQRSNHDAADVARSPARVAFVIDAIESPTAGTERQLLLLIDGLDRARYQPFLCCLRPSRWLRDSWKGCPSYCADIRSFKSPRGWLGVARLASWLRRTGVSVVQTHFRDATIAGCLAAFLARTPVIVSARRGRPLASGPLDALLFRLLNRIPTAFVANSAFSRELAVKQEGIPRDKVFVVPNVLEPGRPVGPDPEARRAALDRLGLCGSAPVIGIVANLNPWKRHDLLLRAAALLKARGVSMRVACVGGGERSALMELASALDLADEVVFAGRRDDVHNLLPAFSVGVLCSDFESSSNALLEYLAAGIPVVCTAVGGCAEAVEDGVNGYLIPPGDPQALAQALERTLLDGIDAAGQAASREALLARHGLESAVAAHLAAYGYGG